MHPSESDRPSPVRHRCAATALALACLAAACGETAAPPAAAPLSPDVWAVVDGREIRKDDVEQAYRRVAPPASTPSEEEALAAKLRLLEELIDRDILLARAQALKIEVTDAELDKAFTERKSNMPDDAFQKELDQRGLTPDDMKRDLRRELTVQKLLQQEVGSKIAVGDQDVRDFYDKNRAQFNVAETRHRIAQIVVTPVRDPRLRNRANDDAATPAEAARKIQMLVARLKGGADFAALAMDYSEDPQSVQQGGDLGFIPASALNQVAPALRQAVLKAKPGDVTTVSSGGGHILMLLVAREEAGQRDLSTPGVREGITDLLRDRREQLMTAAYLAAARNDTKVVNHLARQLVEKRSAAPALAPAQPGRQ
jgi:peptidyl-prolyl cis-trans isomerase SurA